MTIEEQELEESKALLAHYRIRHHQMVDNSAFQHRLITQLRQEIEELRRTSKKI
jgi:hypothetical protein